MDFMLVMSLSCIGLSASFVATGFVRSLWSLRLCFLSTGLLFGFLEAGYQVFLLRLWGSEASMFTQLANFVMGIGSLLAPVIAAPFLSNRVDVDADNITSSHINSHHLKTPELETRLYIVFSFIAAVFAVAGITAQAVWCLFPVTREDEETSRQGSENSLIPVNSILPEKGSTTSYKIWKIVVVILHMMFAQIYMGLNVSIGSYLTVFVVTSRLKLTKQAGTIITTFFWTIFTSCKLLAILYLPYVGDGRNILLGLLVAVAGNAVLIPFADSDVRMLWLGIGLVAAGMSSIYACTFRYLDHFFPVTNLIAAFASVAYVWNSRILMSFPCS